MYYKLRAARVRCNEQDPYPSITHRRISFTSAYFALNSFVTKNYFTIQLTEFLANNLTAMSLVLFNLLALELFF